MPDAPGFLKPDCAEFYVDKGSRKLSLSFDNGPMFNNCPATLSYDRPDDLATTPTSDIRQDSYIGPVDFSINVDGPRGTQTIKGLLENPIPQKYNLSGTAEWQA